ncbi:hypothetical protein V8G54_014105 [Vigna mungo]|uniref:Uncharacterized protein n=1 Tax=Vigna mungo TaxID=3915 RepID=A0AAQ3NH17_VIGMU
MDLVSSTKPSPTVELSATLASKLTCLDQQVCANSPSTDITYAFACLSCDCLFLTETRFFLSAVTRTCTATMVSFGLARTLTAHERSSLLSSGSKERPMSILAGEGSTILKCLQRNEIICSASSYHTEMNAL